METMTQETKLTAKQQVLMSYPEAVCIKGDDGRSLILECPEGRPGPNPMQIDNGTNPNQAWNNAAKKLSKQPTTIVGVDQARPGATDNSVAAVTTRRPDGTLEVLDVYETPPDFVYVDANGKCYQGEPKLVDELLTYTYAMAEARAAHIQRYYKHLVSTAFTGFPLYLNSIDEAQMLKRLTAIYGTGAPLDPARWNGDNSEDICNIEADRLLIWECPEGPPQSSPTQPADSIRRRVSRPTQVYGTVAATQAKSPGGAQRRKDKRKAAKSSRQKNRR